MKLVIYKSSFSKLSGADEDSRRIIQSLPRSEPIIVTAKKLPNPNMYRFFYAMLDKVIENLPVGSFRDPETNDTLPISKDRLLLYLKQRVGWTEDFIHMVSGEYIKVPRSISMDSVTKDELHQFINHSLHVICEELLVGVGQENLKQEIMRSMTY